jgi:hypothetical protein
MKIAVIVALWVFGMLAFWPGVGVIWAGLLQQWDGMFWCGVVSIVSGTVVTGLTRVKVL